MNIRTMSAVIAILVVAVLAIDAMAQEPPRERRRPEGREGWGERGARGERGEFDMEAARERRREDRLNRIKEGLGATDDEWMVLRPRIERIQEIDRAATTGAIRGRLPLADDREPTEIETAIRELYETLGDETATTEQINEKLTALRLAREKHAQEIEEAREELRELVTARQEAELVLRGILE